MKKIVEGNYRDLLIYGNRSATKMHRTETKNIYN